MNIARQKTVTKSKEKRAASDGELHTKEEFISFFGGTKEWDAAAQVN